MSNRSLFTVFSTSVVDQLGLKRVERLQSKEFMGFNGSKMSMTCLEPVTLSIQGIQVTLRNAVERSSPDPFYGIQLGQDFLFSGLSLVDVECHEELSFRVLGDWTWSVGNVSKESFRYYSYDGQIAELPLIYFSPFKGRANMTVWLEESVKVSQCNWCCRVFPRGMMLCQTCKPTIRCYYCDEQCQNAAWNIHKLTKHAHKK